MLIGKDWKITSDSLNVTLERRKRVKGKDGEPEHDRWQVHGYYSTPESALNALVDLMVMESGMTDLKTVIKEINSVKNMINTALLKEHKEEE